MYNSNSENAAPLSRSSRLGICLALLLLVLVGCPAGDSRQAEEATDTQLSDLPAAGDWIVPRALQYYLNDVIEVDYRLENNVTNSPAWIALVPADTESLLSSDNFAAQVEYTHIYELPQGMTKFHARKNGEYILRLFAAKRDDAQMIAQSDVLRIGRAEENQRQLTPPYVTLSGYELPEEIVLRSGMVIAAYWMLDEPLGPDAWLGMVPLSCTSVDAAANHAAAVGIQKLDSKTMSANRFLLKEPGEYVFRVFPSASTGEKMICQSEEFIVSADPPAGD